MLLLGLALRLPPVFADYPFSYYGDELHLIKRSMALGSGDLNPHWFHKPAALMYMLLFSYGSYFLVGAAVGMFESVEQFGGYFLTDMGPFIVIGRCLVVAFGMGTIYVVYRLARKAYGTFLHGLTAALAVAVLYPAVVGSQSVKADVPAGFFVALSFLWFLKADDAPGFRPMALAALLAGVAMGTKYYGIVLLPGYAMLELRRVVRRGGAWRFGLMRAGAVCLLFVVGFFVVSPYNLLDSTWASGIAANVAQRTGIEEASVVFDPDNRVRYVPGLSSTIQATGHFVGKALDPKAAGLGFVALAVAGLLASARRRETREYALALGLPLALFALFCAWWGSFHVNWRHFNAVLPLACTLLLPGALALARLTPAPRTWSVTLALSLLLLPTGRHSYASASHSLARFAPDTRTLSYRWIVENIEPESLILLDEYGPILQPGKATIWRQRARLAGLPGDEAFTVHQDIRLDLLARYPSPEARDYVELAHPWWLDRQPTDAELRGSWRHRDASNPIKARIPDSLAAHRARGVRWVVTNSAAQRRYLADADADDKFPAFVRFYRELRRLEPIRTFDPSDLGARGPTVWIYDLASPRRSADPVPTADLENRLPLPGTTTHLDPWDVIPLAWPSADRPGSPAWPEPSRPSSR